MTDVAEVEEQVDAVEAEITYLQAGSFINRRFVSPGREVNTGRYETHRVKVRNARQAHPAMSLDRNGFTLTNHNSRVVDFFDKAEVDEKYPAEVEAIVRQLTGADRVALTGWMARTSGDIASRQKKHAGYTHQGGVQPPAGEAHVDYLPDRADFIAEREYRRAWPDGRGYRRFIAASVWRAFSEPPQDWPLALCDGSTVSADEGTANTMYVVDEIPDEATMLAHVPDEDTRIAAAIFRYNPRHRWWYYPDMTRDEVVMIKFHDSDRSKPAWRCPHTAFHDASAVNPNHRCSIEFRVVGYFD